LAIDSARLNKNVNIDLDFNSGDFVVIGVYSLNSLSIIELLKQKVHESISQMLLVPNLAKGP